MLQSFLSYLISEKRCSDHTVVAYKTDLNQFEEFAELSSQKDWLEVNHQLIRSWVVSLNTNQLTNKTINRKLSSIRAFYKWMQKQNLIDHNPCQNMKGPKVKKRLPQFVKESELEIQFTGNDDDFEHVRDYLIIEMFYQTGIRLSELIELKDEEVRSNQIKVLGKRNKERIIPISKDLAKRIEDYRALRVAEMGSTDHFFVLKNSNKLYPKLVYRRINSYLGEVSNVDQKSPHVLRHTFATHMLNNGAGLETLKELLGHANLAATQVYTHNSFTQLANIYSQAHPRGHKKR